MERVQGNQDVALIELINPVKNKWRVRWDVAADESGNASFMEADLDHRPTETEIKTIIFGWIDEQTRSRILSGFSYEGNVVWLSIENQSNYDRDYNKAKLGLPNSLPVTYKLGSDEMPVYRTFETIDDLEEFYQGYTSHIRKAQLDGWNAKDAVDLELYRVI